MGLGIAKCVFCSAPITLAKTGRRRLYCSSRCRSAATRRRHKLTAGEQESADERAMRDMLGLPRDPDEALAQTILLALSLISALHHLAPRTRPQFAGRCTALASDVGAALHTHFPECLPS
jgi:hypothetical protein